MKKIQWIAEATNIGIVIHKGLTFKILRTEVVFDDEN